MKLLPLLLLVASASGQNVFDTSLATMAAGQTIDSYSSYGKLESNPTLGSGTKFGAQQLAIKSGLTATAIVIELLVARHWPKTRKAMMWVNFGVAAETGAVAVHNFQIRR